LQKTPIQISYQKIAHFLIILVILTCMLIVGKDILFPLVMGALLSFMLRPLFNWFFGVFNNRMLACFMAILVAFVPLILSLGFFGLQLHKVILELPDIMRGLQEGINELSIALTDIFNLRGRAIDDYLDEMILWITKSPFTFLGTGILTSSSILLNFALVVVYTFLFLLYRKAFKKLILQQFSEDLRSGGAEMLFEVQQVAKQYFSGMLSVMLILGILNSTGLYFIGLDFPILWGFLAAALAIIPYIGTFMGGLLPFLYSFASGDGYWQPVAIIFMYAAVQTLEGNFITPKVVGRSVNLNPIAAILALFVGEAIWGLSGMIVAIPILAIFRIVLDHLPNWRPVALALSDDFYYKSDLLLTKYDKPRYRLINLFAKKNSFTNSEEAAATGEVEEELPE
jgi:predicted PurR-regulated permease PerM